MKQFEAEKGKGRDKLFNYFISKKMKNLIEGIGDF